MKERCIQGNFAGAQCELKAIWHFSCPVLLLPSVFLLLRLHSLWIAHPATMPLPKRDRKVEAAKRTIREAFDDLSRAVSPEDSHDFSSVTLENVQNAALDIENQLGARSSLRNMRRLMPLFSGLQHYSAAIEVLCNGTPYLPWIWAPIKLILNVSRGCRGLLPSVPLANTSMREPCSNTLLHSM